mmetsp:Transcript_102551/g.296578  ORF Transcript_102551/g.296578 Transcript_102551/m.296578 type:complete len:240 (+) Transcript_102551:124-843(+)
MTQKRKQKYRTMTDARNANQDPKHKINDESSPLRISKSYATKDENQVVLRVYRKIDVKEKCSLPTMPSQGRGALRRRSIDQEDMLPLPLHKTRHKRSTSKSEQLQNENDPPRASPKREYSAWHKLTWIVSSIQGSVVKSLIGACVGGIDNLTFQDLHRRKGTKDQSSTCQRRRFKVAERRAHTVPFTSCIKIGNLSSSKSKVCSNKSSAELEGASKRKSRVKSPKPRRKQVRFFSDDVH